jgi:hypothetical protein
MLIYFKKWYLYLTSRRDALSTHNSLDCSPQILVFSDDFSNDSRHRGTGRANPSDVDLFRGSIRVRGVCILHVTRQLVRMLRMLPRQHPGLQVLCMRRRQEEHRQEDGRGASREL